MISATCVRILDKEPPAPAAGVAGGSEGRILDLVWASVTEDVLAVRARLEGWSPSPAAARRQTATLSSVEPR